MSFASAPTSTDSHHADVAWPSWRGLWEPGRTHVVDPRALWTEEWSLAEVLAQDPGFGFRGRLRGAPDLAHPLRELLRRRGLWGGPGRRVVQRMVALAANFARVTGAGSLDAYLLRTAGPRPDLLQVPEGRLRLLRFYLPEGLPVLPGHDFRPGGILLLRHGAPISLPAGPGRNLVLCFEARQA